MGSVSKPRPLSAQDNLSGFNCGETVLNDWLQQRAKNNHKQGFSRVFVVDGKDGQIAGYTALSTTEVERDTLKKSYQRNAPPKIPCVLLGQLAVDLRYQGHGIAKALMYFALNAAMAAAKYTGAFGLVTHPLNNELKGFYASYGFEVIPGDEEGGMILRIKDLEQNIAD